MIQKANFTYTTDWDSLRPHNRIPRLSQEKREKRGDNNSQLWGAREDSSRERNRGDPPNALPKAFLEEKRERQKRKQKNGQRLSTCPRQNHTGVEQKSEKMLVEVLGKKKVMGGRISATRIPRKKDHQVAENAGKMKRKKETRYLEGNYPLLFANGKERKKKKNSDHTPLKKKQSHHRWKKLGAAGPLQQCN